MPQSDELSMKEAMEILNVSKPTIYALIKRGELHPYKKKIGRRVYFSRTEVQAIADAPAERVETPKAK